MIVDVMIVDNVYLHSLVRSIILTFAIVYGLDYQSPRAKWGLILTFASILTHGKPIEPVFITFVGFVPFEFLVVYIAYSSIGIRMLYDKIYPSVQS